MQAENGSESLRVRSQNPQPPGCDGAIAGSRYTSAEMTNIHFRLGRSPLARARTAALALAPLVLFASTYALARTETARGQRRQPDGTTPGTASAHIFSAPVRRSLRADPGQRHHLARAIHRGDDGLCPVQPPDRGGSACRPEGGGDRGRDFHRGLRIRCAARRRPRSAVQPASAVLRVRGAVRTGLRRVGGGARHDRVWSRTGAGWPRHRIASGHRAAPGDPEIPARQASDHRHLHQSRLFRRGVHRPAAGGMGGRRASLAVVLWRARRDRRAQSGACAVHAAVIAAQQSRHAVRSVGAGVRVHRGRTAVLGGGRAGDTRLRRVPLRRPAQPWSRQLHRAAPCRVPPSGAALAGEADVDHRLGRRNADGDDRGRRVRGLSRIGGAIADAGRASLSARHRHPVLAAPRRCASPR